MKNKCVKCGSSAADKDHILCPECRLIENQKQKEVEKEVRHFEKQEFGQSFEEFLLSHSKDCPDCQGNEALAIYCFWKGGGNTLK